MKLARLVMCVGHLLWYCVSSIKVIVLAKSLVETIIVIGKGQCNAITHN